MTEQDAVNINMLGAFCGKRDLDELTPDELTRRAGIEQVDVMVLFGGSILCGGDVMARAMKRQIAKKYVIVGGAGHTTEALRRNMRESFPELDTAGKSEAEVFAAYLKHRYQLAPDLLECRSTNCGNNITYLLDLLKENRVSFRSILLSQDAAMQRRMEAGLRKYVPDSVTILNYAVYSAHVAVAGSTPYYQEDIWGMWEIGRYLSLLMGEIPRLTDDAGGYGPHGKDYIAHVDIPPEVEKAYLELKQNYAGSVREANPLFASQ